MGNCRSASAAADDVHIEQLEEYSAVQSFDTRNTCSGNAGKTENANAAKTYTDTEILPDLQQQLPSAPTAEKSTDRHDGSLFEATFTAQCVDDFIDSKTTIPLVSTQAELLISTLPSIQEPGGSRVSVEENPSKALVVVEKSPGSAYSLVDIENIDIETTIVSVPVEEHAGNKISAYALDEEEITKALVTVLVEENAKNIASAYAGSLVTLEEETSSALVTVEVSADHIVALDEETIALLPFEESADHYCGLDNMEMKNALVVAENSTGEKGSAYALEKDNEALCSALIVAENSTGEKGSAYALEKDNEYGCTNIVSTKENCGNNTFAFVSEQEKAESMNQFASVSVAYKQQACQWAIDEALLPEKKRYPKPEDILTKRNITGKSRRPTSASGHYRGNGKHGSGDPLNFMANW